MLNDLMNKTVFAIFSHTLRAFAICMTRTAFFNTLVPCSIKGLSFFYENEK